MTAMHNYPRYAVYFAPDPGGRWWDFACRCLGRDPISDCKRSQPPVSGYDAATLSELTAEPRRYGFHATLKAPFALTPGVDAEEVYRAAGAFAGKQQALSLGVLAPHYMDGYLALIPEVAPPELGALARACVEHFDFLRAPSALADVQRRRAAGLTARQEALLERWGYPYVMEEFRFHMTLTGKLSNSEAERLSAGLSLYLDELNQEPPLSLDAICIFEQAAAGFPFRLARRYAFDGAVTCYQDGKFK